MKIKNICKHFVMRIDLETNKCIFFAFINLKDASEFILTDGKKMNTEDNYFRYAYLFVDGDCEINDEAITWVPKNA